MVQIEIKLLTNNIIFEIIKQFSLNNIDTIFHKYIGFTKSLIGIIANVMAVNDSIPNFPNNHLTLVNIKINAIIDSDFDNFSSNKENYIFNNCIFLSNYDYYKNNLNIGNNFDSPN